MYSSAKASSCIFTKPISNSSASSSIFSSSCSALVHRLHSGLSKRNEFKNGIQIAKNSVEYVWNGNGVELNGTTVGNYMLTNCEGNGLCIHIHWCSAIHLCANYIYVQNVHERFETPCWFHLWISGKLVQNFSHLYKCYSTNLSSYFLSTRSYYAKTKFLGEKALSFQHCIPAEDFFGYTAFLQSKCSTSNNSYSQSNLSQFLTTATHVHDTK